MTKATNHVNETAASVIVHACLLQALGKAGRIAVRALACLFGIGLVSWLSLGNAHAATSVSGTIAASTTWSASQSPYVLSGDVTVDAWAVLTVQAGTVIRMTAGANLIVKNGGLNAQGTSNAPISITSSRDVANPNPAPAPGDWGQLQFQSGTIAASTQLNYVQIKYGSGVTLTGASPTLNNVSIWNHNGPAIAIDLNSSPSGTGLVASGNTLNGILVPPGDIAGSVSWGLKGIPYVIAQGIVGVGQTPIELTPPSLGLIAGKSDALQVSVLAPAPAGGLAIDVASSDTSVAAVPASVTIAQGSTSATVTVNAVGSGSAKISASSAGLGAANANVSVTSLPDLVVSNASIGAVGGNQNGSYSIPVTYTVTNIGLATATGTWHDLAYLSMDATLDNADQNLGGSNTHSTPLAPGASYTVTTTFTTSSTTALGNYTLFIKADGRGAAVGSGANTDNGVVTEFDESNNTQALPLTLSTQPDLTISSASIGTVATNANGSYSIPVTFTVKNVGGSATEGSWYDLAYLSTDATLDNLDQNLSGSNLHSTSLLPGASYTVTMTFTTTTTTAAGAYTLFIKADGHGATIGNGTNTDNGAITESNEANNTQALPVTLSLPDLTVSNASVGAIVANQNGSFSIPVTYTVTNIGTTTAQPNWYDLAYLSLDATLDNADQNLNGSNYVSTALAPGASYTVTKTFTTTTTTAAGSYTLFIKADGHGTTLGTGTNTDTGNVIEANETNNTQALPITLGGPDLAVSNASLGALVANQDGSFSITVTYKVTNIGTGTAQPSWYDLAYLSSNATLDNADQNLSGNNYVSTALAPGASYTVTKTFTTTTTTAAGSYTLFIKADGHGSQVGGTNTDAGAVVEANEANNTQALSVALGGPDLTVSNASAGAIVANQNGSFSIPVTYTVTNIGTGTAQPSWYDLAYLSPDATLDNTDQNLSGSNYVTTALAPGASYTVTKTFTTTTATVPGSYTLFIKSDGHGSQVGGTNTDAGAVVEANEANNTQALAVTLTRPDLTVSNASAGAIVSNHDGSFSIPVTYTVTNTGAAAAQPVWFDLVYLSTDATLDNADQNLSGYIYVNTALAPGASYTVTKIFFTTTTTTVPGSYTLFIKADGHSPTQVGGTNTDAGNIVEANEANNTASLSVHLGP